VIHKLRNIFNYYYCCSIGSLHLLKPYYVLGTKLRTSHIFLSIYPSIYLSIYHQLWNLFPILAISGSSSVNCSLRSKLQETPRRMLMSIKASKKFIFSDLQGILNFPSRNFLSSFLIPFHTCLHTYIQIYFNTQTNLWWRYYYFQHFIEKDAEAH